jgi:hypothetical protein
MATQDEPQIDKGGEKGGLPLAKPGVKWRDLPGATLALTSLAILGAAAVVSTPFWVLYRRKRKRVDALVNAPGEKTETAEGEKLAAESDSAAEPLPGQPPE